MNVLNQQVNIKQLATKLKELQNEFEKYDGLQGYINAKPLKVDFEVDEDEIVIGFNFSKSEAITVVVKTDYSYDELAHVEIGCIEVDSADELYTIDEGDHSALLLECKRIIHDAVHYKLLDEDSEIETNFYSEVYA